MRLVVELVAGATQQKETHTLSYADILSFMIQCVVDIAVYGMSLYTCTYSIYRICLKKCPGVYFSSGPLHPALKQDGRLFEVGVCSLKLFCNCLKLSIHHYQSYN